MNIEELCGNWSSLASMNVSREKFAAASGPDKDAPGATSIDSDPRVYVIGGLGQDGFPLDSCEKYNPDTNTWSFITSLPEPVGNCAGAFAPDYVASTLGYIYVIGDNTGKIYQYDIKQDIWNVLPLPFSVSNASIQYLDDFGGPLAELFIAIFGVELPPCTDSQTIWIVGGDGTERETWYITSNTKGELVGEWFRGPNLPLERKAPLVGRVFWRDAGITSFGVSNCASIVVCGGNDEHDKPTKDVQLLVRNNCNWAWITRENNPTSIPNNILRLALPVSDGAFGTEQWPETLVTGGRALLFGGIPADNFDGSTQLGQFRFIDGRLQRDPCIASDDKRSAWDTTTSMPGQRISFRALPLSQANSSLFGGRRVSRFLCVGGRDGSGVLNRSQLFQLPVPPQFVETRRKKCRTKLIACDEKPKRLDLNKNLIFTNRNRD